MNGQSATEKQRHSAFVYACIAMLGADIALWFLGMNAYGVWPYEILHPVHFVLTILLFVLYRQGKLPATYAVTILCTANQLAILFEMWLCVTKEPLHINLIMGYIVMATLNMTLVLMAYIRVLPFVLAALTMAGYGACCYVSREPALIGMLPVFSACFLVLALLGHHLGSNIHRLEKEKTELEENEQQILNIFEFDKEQLNAYISLAKKKGLSSEQTGALLDVIGKQAQENIRDNVSFYYRQREIDYANLRTLLPELTASEIEICDLILKEKKLKELIRILGKSEGNITSQRTNIRKKLGLSPSDNLCDALVRITKLK